MTAEEQIAAALSGVFVEYVGKEPVERLAFNNPRNIELAKVCRDMPKPQKIVPAAVAEPSEQAAMPPQEVFPLPRQPKLREILMAVVAETGIGPLDIRSHRRSRPIVRARMMVNYIARTATTKSFPEIGRFLDRDHSTLVHSFQVVTDDLSSFEPTLGRVTARLHAICGDVVDNGNNHHLIKACETDRTILPE